MPNKYKKQKQKKRGMMAKPAGGPNAIPPILPPNMTVKLVYSNRKAFGEASVAAGGNYTFALNNLYDPDKTGIGQQPVNFDQLCTLYTLFRVVKVDYDVEIVHVTAQAAGVTATVGLVPTWNDALPTDPIAWFALSGARSKCLTPYGGSNYARFSGSIDPWSVLSIRRQQYMNDTDYTCTATGGPVRNVYLNIFCVGSGGTAACLLTISLVYTVEAMIPVLNSLS